jgi:uncharacterized membrane protein YphA (DoxX/SURF4 family)
VLIWLPPLVTRIILLYRIPAIWMGEDLSPRSNDCLSSHLGFGWSTSFVAVFVPWVEFLARLLFLLGVMTEIASVALIIDMTVAIVVANQNVAGHIGELFRFYDFLYIALLLWLLISGPGRVSAYRFVEKETKYS